MDENMGKEYVIIKRVPVEGEEERKLSVLYPEGEDEIKEIIQNTIIECKMDRSDEWFEQDLLDILEVITVEENVNPNWLLEDESD